MVAGVGGPNLSHVWQLPGKLKPPTLLIHGEISDTFTQGSVIAFKLINRCTTIASVKGAGHLVPQEKPDQVGVAGQEFSSPLRIEATTGCGFGGGITSFS